MDKIITNRQYQNEIQSIAKSAVKEARRDDRPLEEVIDEILDSHRWVIYTYQAIQTALWMENRDAWRDLTDEFTDEIRAYAGMREDIWDYIWRNGLD